MAQKLHAKRSTWALYAAWLCMAAWVLAFIACTGLVMSCWMSVEWRLCIRDRWGEVLQVIGWLFGGIATVLSIVVLFYQGTETLPGGLKSPSTWVRPLYIILLMIGLVGVSVWGNFITDWFNQRANKFRETSEEHFRNHDNARTTGACIRMIFERVAQGNSSSLSLRSIGATAESDWIEITQSKDPALSTLVRNTTDHDLANALMTRSNLQIGWDELLDRWTLRSGSKPLSSDTRATIVSELSSLFVQSLRESFKRAAVLNDPAWPAIQMDMAGAILERCQEGVVFTKENKAILKNLSGDARRLNDSFNVLSRDVRRLHRESGDALNDLATQLSRQLDGIHDDVIDVSNKVDEANKKLDGLTLEIVKKLEAKFVFRLREGGPNGGVNAEITSDQIASGGASVDADLDKVAAVISRMPESERSEPIQALLDRFDVAFGSRKYLEAERLVKVVLDFSPASGLAKLAKGKLISYGQWTGFREGEPKHSAQARRAELEQLCRDMTPYWRHSLRVFYLPDYAMALPENQRAETWAMELQSLVYLADEGNSYAISMIEDPKKNSFAKHPLWDSGILKALEKLDGEALQSYYKRQGKPVIQ